MKKDKINKILKDTKVISIQNNSLCFLPGDRIPYKTAGFGLKGKIQSFLKKHGKLYKFLVRYFGPVCFNFFCERKIKKILEQYSEKDVILNVGSGPAIYMDRRDMINIDIFAFDEVNIVADADDLPIIDGLADVIINIAMLEHVADPKAVVKEMFRVTKRGGIVICYLPFISPFHAAPCDFSRWTLIGAKKLFSEFEEVKVIVGGGPTSGMLWVLQEWVAILLSFGSKILHDIIFLFLMVLTAPIKFLDLFLVKFPYAENIASGFYVIAKKSEYEYG